MCVGNFLHAWARIPNVCHKYTRLGSMDNKELQHISLENFRLVGEKKSPFSPRFQPFGAMHHHISPLSYETLVQEYILFFLIYMLLQSPVSNQIPIVLFIYKSLLGCVSTHVSASACMHTHNDGQSNFSRMTQTNVRLGRLVPNQFVVPFKETNLDVYISKQCI